MGSRLFCSQGKSMRVTRSASAASFLLGCALWVLAMAPRAAAGDAPPWMHALVGATLPSYDEKTDAVLLYSETNVTVLSVDKIRTHVREAYKILRPEGREHGTVSVSISIRAEKSRICTAGASQRKARTTRLRTRTRSMLLRPSRAVNWCRT